MGLSVSLSFLILLLFAFFSSLLHNTAVVSSGMASISLFLCVFYYKHEINARSSSSSTYYASP